jgi:hypothetical protein
MKKVKWIVLNTFIVTMCVLATIYAREWAWNVYRMFAWFYFVGAVMFALGGGSLSERIERTFPDYMNTAVGIGLAILCAAYGHIGYGILAMTEPIFCSIGYSRNHEKHQIEKGAVAG